MCLSLLYYSTVHAAVIITTPAFPRGINKGSSISLSLALTWTPLIRVAVRGRPTQTALMKRSNQSRHSITEAWILHSAPSWLPKLCGVTSPLNQLLQLQTHWPFLNTPTCLFLRSCVLATRHQSLPKYESNPQDHVLPSRDQIPGCYLAPPRSSHFSEDASELTCVDFSQQITQDASRQLK